MEWMLLAGMIATLVVMMSKEESVMVEPTRTAPSFLLTPGDCKQPD